MGSYVPPPANPVTRPPINNGDQIRYPVDQYENPYYLHSADHAGLILVSDRLTTASDFHSWRRSILMALNVRNKLGFINGTITKPPEDHRDFGAWSRCNDIVSTWLMNSVDKKIGQSLLYIATVQGIWNNLLSRFKQDDAPRIFDIEQKLSKIEQGSMDISTYYTALLTLWEEHRNYVELPVCTCGRCECDAAVKWEHLQQRSRVTKFLKELNEGFDQTRRHILMLKPIPTIKEAFNMVTQDERQRNVKPLTRVDSVAFQNTSMINEDENAYVAAYNTVRPNQKPICTHCGKVGHTIQKCYKVHGYPPGMKTGNTGYTYKPNPQLHVQPRMPMMPQPRMQFPAQPYTNSMQKANVVAQVYAETGAYPSEGYSQAPMMNPYGSYPMPHITHGGNNLSLQDFTPQQIEQMISQFQAQVQVPEPAASSSNPSPLATVSEHGFMALTSTSGTIIPFPSTSLKYENNDLKFQNHTLSALQKFLPSDAWIIDSGASSHVCSDLAMFRELKSVSGVTVTLPNGTRVSITHIGTVHITQKLILHNVLHVPDFKFNLMSVSSLVKTISCSAHFYVDCCLIQELSQGLMIGRGRLYHNLYILETENTSPSTSTPAACLFTGSVLNDGHLWHQRLGHPSSVVLQKLVSIIPSLKSFNSESSPCCICPLAKQKRLAYISHNNLASNPFDLVHLDIWGPFSIESIEGFRYFLTVVDDCTRTTWVYMLRNKKDVSSVFPEFIKLVSTQFNAKIKAIRSDNAPELGFTEIVKEHGMLHHFSCAYTPQQNSVVERKHQHILNVARALLFQSNIPMQYWSDCVTTAVFLINRLPSPLLNNKSPYELILNKQPDYSLLKNFGCLCFVSTNAHERTKFTPRARACVFLGYPSGYKGYKVLDLESHSVTVSRNVVFKEHVFPFKTSELLNKAVDMFPNSILPLPAPLHFVETMPLIDEDSLIPTTTDSRTADNHASSSSSALPSIIPPSSNTETQDIDSNAVPITRSKRTTRAPSYLSEYHCSLVPSISTLPPTDSSIPIHPLPEIFTASSPKKTTPYPISTVVSYDKYTPLCQSYIFAYNTETEPKTFSQAMKSEKWIRVAVEELQAMELNKTWSVESLPPDKNVVGCKWVFTIKYNPDGTVERYKARLVAQGFTQQEGIDFLDTFSPVAKLTSAKMMLGLAAITGWTLTQMDVSDAFLHGDLDEEIFMSLPQGYTPPAGTILPPNPVCRLLKSIYGLKQASRQWYKRLSSVLLGANFI